MATAELAPRSPARPKARRRRGDRARWVTVAVLLASALAWLAVALRHGMPWTPAGLPAAHHGAPVDLPEPTPALPSAGGSHGGDRALPRLLGWTAMVVAMMLPPALPLLRVTARLVARRRHPTLLVTTTALAFLAVWVAAGLFLLLGEAALGALVRSTPVLARNPHLLSGVAAVAAGAYQLSPWKDACLAACRSPRGLAMTTWSGRRSPAAEASVLGARYGAVCVGCCWGLMLVSVAVGALVLPVMVLVALLMALERLCPEVRAFVPLGALVAVGVGLLIVTRVLPGGLG